MNAFTDAVDEEIEQSVPARFEKTVAKHADRLAVKAGDRLLTYAALNQLANRIARAVLAQRGPASEPIALLFEHGIDIIAAIFGILKAGKFYVALDPSVPLQRNAYILEHSQAGLLITNTRNLDLATKLLSRAGALLNIDDIDDAACGDNPSLSSSADNLAAIVYTSGSTGDPNGVVRNHRSLLSTLLVNPGQYPVCADDRLSLLHSLNFGSGEIDLLMALLNGASLFPFDLQANGTQSLKNWLKEEQITICHMGPALFRQLSDSLTGQGRAEIPNLQLIRLGTAAITPLEFEVYKKIFCPGTTLRIGMGSTEARDICAATLDQNFSYPTEGTPVGYPVAGKKVFLLDENGREVEPGKSGEIAVKSRYLPLGYWRNPELTKAKFLPDPSGGDERVYLTGDLGRMMPDGFLVHLGRKDFVVKIRGYRISFNEIENVLMKHPSVKESAVTSWDDNKGEKWLAAYIVSGTEPPANVSELVRFLQGRIPHYMIPSAFVFMESLPQINGKVDRRSLPRPERIRPNLDQPYTAPTTAIEKQLIQIWEEVLNFQPVGIRDNFFDLGGNSLLATRIFADIDKEFQKRFPLSTLFHSATIEKLASLINQTNPLSERSLVSIQPHGSRLPFFCVHELFGDVFCYRLLSQYLGKEQPFYGLQPNGLNAAQKLSFDIKSVAAHYVEEMQRVQPEGPYAIGGYSSGGVVAFEMAQQLRTRGQAVAIIALFDSVAVTSGQNKLTRSWSFLRNLPTDLASWVIELSRLTPRQCFHLVRFKLRMLKNHVTAILHAPASFHETAAANAIKAWGDLFQFSESQRQFAIAQSRALRHYTPQVYPDRLTLFRAARTAPLYYSHGRDRGWRKLAAGGLDIQLVPGNHMTILREPHVRVLAEELRACLDKAQ